MKDEGLGGTSPVVQQLRLCVPNEGGLALIPDQGTRSHMPQLRLCMAETEDPAQLNKYFLKKEEFFTDQCD